MFKKLLFIQFIDFQFFKILFNISLKEVRLN
jgi:hypothetical protein